jgi:hypothetical protein
MFSPKKLDDKSVDKRLKPYGPQTFITDRSFMRPHVRLMALFPVEYPLNFCIFPLIKRADWVSMGWLVAKGAVMAVDPSKLEAFLG